MDKFNLTFNGELLPGHNLAEVKARFAEALSIDDPDRVTLFFSGKQVTLRRNLDKNTAEAFYTKMYHTGAIVKLEPVQKKNVSSDARPGMDREFHNEGPGSIDQSWPIRSTTAKKSVPASSAAKKGNAVLQAEEQQRKKLGEEADRNKVQQIAEDKKAVKAAAALVKEKHIAKQAAEKKAKIAVEKIQAEQKQKQEEAARKKAAEVEARKKARKEEARKKAQEREAKKKAQEEAARKKAEEREAKKKAQEKAARKKAAEKEVRRKAREEEARKKAAEEAAHQKAVEEEARKKAAEEAARKKALAEEARKKAAEEAARQKALEEEARKKAAEEAAHQKALEEEARKKAAEEAARKKALEEEARRKAAEEAVRQKVLKEEARKKVAEEAAIQKSLKIAAKKRAEEKAARLRAELAEQKQRHAEEAAQAKADEQRIEDELRALAIAQRAEEAALALLLKKKKQHEEELQSQEKAARKLQEQQAQEQAAKQRTKEKRQEQAAFDRAAEGSARLEELQRLARPSRATRTGHSKRQPGAPNLFSLKPFRNTAEIRQRVESAQQLMKVMFFISGAALLALLILGLRYAMLPTPDSPVHGASAIVVDQHSGLLISAGTQLFTLDRSGVDTASYSLSELNIGPQINLLGFSASDELLLQDRRNITASNSDSGLWPTLNCNIQTVKCRPNEPVIGNAHISSWVVDPRTGESFLASPTESMLTKLSADGKTVARALVDMPALTTLALHEGLLYMNGSTGPAISIFRPDNKGFGQQLDEVLLLPPPAVKLKQTQVRQFLWSGGSWWVVMMHPESLKAGLYRFDPKWNFLASVALNENSHPLQLLNWADKVLVVDSGQLAIQRFNSDGSAEAPLIPTALQNYIESETSNAALALKFWHVSLGVLALVVIAAYFLGRLQYLRSLVYKQDKVRGAEPLDDKEKLLRWIDPEDKRNRIYIKIAALYGTLGLSTTAVFLMLGFPATVLFATVLLFTGPALALGILWSSPSGHIGIFQDQLILVDRHNMYHMGSGARVHYRNNFLLLDDIVVFIGTPQLPIFSYKHLAKEVVPMALAGVKVDRKTVMIKLIQSSHPIAKGLYACVACLSGAIMCLLLY